MIPRLPRNLFLGTGIVVLLVLQWAIPVPLPIHQQQISPVSPFLTGLSFPVSLKFAPDGRIFFTEKNTGSIRVVLQNGTLLSTPYATISNIFNGGEAGLLGIALDPSFASNGVVYVYYTYRDSGSYTHGRIVKYTTVDDHGIGPVSIFDVVSSAPGSVYHNGGYIKFGPDGKLYAQVGEFHNGPQSQNQSTMEGKMLRMNTDGSVPSDNPDPASLVWASGIRNAFGFDFDLSNGRLIATEAGPTSDDEINIIVKGGNYGWPTCVGVCHNPAFIDPIVDFNPVVTPTGIATVAPNQYYFGEWNTGNLVILQLYPNGTVLSMTTVYTQQGGIVAVELAPNSLLYYTSPEGIYTYDVRVPPLPATGVDPIVVVLLTAAVFAAILTVAYVTLHNRNRNNRRQHHGKNGGGAIGGALCALALARMLMQC